MKKIFQRYIGFFACAAFISCSENAANENPSQNVSTEATAQPRGQESVNDDVSQRDVVKIAVGSKDHTTLVAALKQADYVTELSNAGPFTVFAPTNAAFDKLPKGTVDDLMKPENKDKLRDILEYHVAVGGYKQENLTDGQTINQANLKNITVAIKDGKMIINNTANVVATIPASNGIIYVIDEVLLPPAGN
jgi:uncharacterized surface protein with fasciclin (FAS1) repeats